MKYKVGDEVLVKAKLIGCASSERCMLKVDRTELFTDAEGILPVPDMTAEEAWEIAGKLVREYFENEEFGSNYKSSYDLLMKFSHKQAKAKIDAWEAENEIKVGDDVVPKKTPNVDEHKFIVTRIYKDDGEIDGVSLFDGGVFSGRKIENYQKTGRHIDIEGLLKQIGGNE